MPKFILLGLFLFLVGVGTFSRFYGLTIGWDHPRDDEKSLLYRPFHLDEAVQGRKLGKLLDEGAYYYNPKDLHGPGLIYSTLPVAFLRGEKTGASLTDFTLRSVPACYGVMLLLLLWAWRREMGSLALLGGATIIALSPIMVFYSRYYIMEIPMVFWITVAMLASWRYCQRPGYGWAILFGVAGGLAHATKETGAISFFTMLVAGAAVMLGHGQWRAPAGKYWKHFAASLVCGLFVSMLCFSVLLREPKAITDSVKTYFLYLDRAEGSGHDKPWYYYFKLLAFNRQPEGGPFWTEGLTLFLGAIGLVVAFTPAAKRLGEALFWRWVALYTLLTAFIYSAIPYKTPWSMLCWVFTLMLMAGLGLAYLVSLRRPFYLVPALVWILFGVAVANLGKQLENSLTRFRADDRNPFVYAHTPGSLLNLVRNVHEMAALHPDGKNMKIAIYHEEGGWPLPWYFRAFPNLGLDGALPADRETLRTKDVIVISPDDDASLMEITEDSHEFETIYGIRDDLKIYNYVEKNLYQLFLDSRG